MATNLLHFQAAVIGACAQNPDQVRQKIPWSNRWTPLFRWPSEPDYIEYESTCKIKNEKSDPRPLRTRYAPGCFTEEKARQLRMMMLETETFHDAMYHSAIASRLASDFTNRSDLWTGEWLLIPLLFIPELIFSVIVFYINVNELGARGKTGSSWLIRWDD